MILFGLKIQNNFFDKFLSGITFTSFSVFLIHLVYSDLFIGSLSEIVLKLSIYSLMVSMISSFACVKYKSQKIIKFHEELDDYSCKINMKHHSFRWLFWLILCFLIILSYLSHNHLDKTVDEIYKTTTLSQYMEFTGSLFIIYGYGWFYSCQWIHFEFKLKFYRIIGNYLNSLKAKNSLENFKPTVNELISAQKTIHQFIHFQTLLAKNIDFIQYFIVLLNVFLFVSLRLILSIAFEKEWHSVIVNILILFSFSFLYFIGTEIILFIKSQLIRNFHSFANHAALIFKFSIFSIFPKPILSIVLDSHGVSYSI